MAGSVSSRWGARAQTHSAARLSNDGPALSTPTVLPMRNITLAVRMLLKTPFVSTVAILSLALGIGANAAIYSLFDQLLIRSLPVYQPERLVNLTAPGVMPGSNSCNQQGDCDEVWSYPMFRDLEREQTALAGIAASRLFGASLAIDNEPSLGQGVWVSGQFFSTLGVQPALGRLIGPSDDVTPLGHDVVVISHDLWRDRFAERPDVVGQLRIPESQAKDVALGQPASIDTRNGIVRGTVSRKDPSAVGGTVLVDVALEGPLPAGAVPDLSVDGTIEIQKMTNILYTGRPAFGPGSGNVGLFKLEPNGDYAVRVSVELGRSSVNTIEILRGLEIGDKVVLSDMTQYANVDRVRIK